MNSHLKNQAYNIPFVRRESCLGHSVKILLQFKKSVVFCPAVCPRSINFVNFLFEYEVLPFIFNLDS